MSVKRANSYLKARNDENFNSSNINTDSRAKKILSVLENFNYAGG
jgi:hypothetical protein